MLAGCGGLQLSGVPRIAPLGIGGARLRPSLATKFAVAIDHAKIVLVGTGWVAPSGVAVDDKGNVYVSDYQLGEIRKVSPPFVGRTHGKIRVVAKELASPWTVDKTFTLFQLHRDPQAEFCGLPLGA